MRTSKAVSSRNQSWTMDSSGAIFTVVLALGLMLGSYAVAQGAELGQATASIVMSSYKVKLTGKLYEIFAEYVWQIIILVMFLLVCLSSRKGELLACAIPFVSGVHLGAVLTTLTAGIASRAIVSLAVSVYLPSMLKAVCLLLIFTALRSRCGYINKGTEVTRSVGIVVGLVIYIILLFAEAVMFITVFR